MKKYLKVFILIFCCLCLCGCANIEYQRVTDDTGQIMDKFTIELDKREIVGRIGETRYLELKEDIKHDVEEYVSAIQNRITTLQREMGGMMDFQSNVSATSSKWYSVSSTTDQIFVQVNYANSEYYRNIHNISNEGGDSNNGEIVSNWFVSKYIIKTENAFDNIEDLEAGHNYYDFYTGKYGEFDMSEVGLTQIYGTTDDRLKSNADYVENIDGITYHLWEIDSKDAGYKTCELTYYYLTAVGTGWYVVALALSVVLALVLISVWIVKKIKSNRYKKRVNFVSEKEAGNED